MPCRLSKIPQELDRYIAASQVGITLSSLVAGAYAQAILAPRAAPLLVAVGGLDPDAALQIIAAVVDPCRPDDAVGDPRRAGAEGLALQHPTETLIYTVDPDAVVAARCTRGSS